MTPAEVIVNAKNLVEDSKFARSPDVHRDAVFLNLVNQTVQNIAVLRPDLFATLGVVDLVVNTPIQSSPAGSTRVIDVLDVVGGSIVREISRDVLELSASNWTSTAGVPIHWMRHTRNPTKFYVYPVPDAATQVTLEYALSPPVYALNDTIDLPSAYMSAVAAGVGALALMIYPNQKDAPLVESLERRFREMIVESVQGRQLTDYKSAGLDPKLMME